MNHSNVVFSSIECHSNLTKGIFFEAFFNRFQCWLNIMFEFVIDIILKSKYLINWISLWEKTSFLWFIWYILLFSYKIPKPRSKLWAQNITENILQINSVILSFPPLNAPAISIYAYSSKHFSIDSSADWTLCLKSSLTSSFN